MNPNDIPIGSCDDVTNIVRIIVITALIVSLGFNYLIYIYVKKVADAVQVNDVSS